MKQLIGIISLLFIFSCTGNSQKLTPAQFEAKLANSNVQLVDVRTPDEFAAGTLTAAVNIDFNNPNFAAELQKLDTYKPLCIFCQKGGRSAKAHEIAKKVGFQQVIELNGGYEAWQKAKNR